MQKLCEGENRLEAQRWQSERGRGIQRGGRGGQGSAGHREFEFSPRSRGKPWKAVEGIKEGAR